MEQNHLLLSYIVKILCISYFSKLKLLLLSFCFLNICFNFIWNLISESIVNTELNNNLIRTAWVCTVHTSSTTFSHVVFYFPLTYEIPRAKGFCKIKHTHRLSKSEGSCGVCTVKQFLKCLQRILIGSIPWVALARGQPAGQGKWLFPSISQLWCWGWSPSSSSELLNRRKTRVARRESSSRGWRPSS